MLQLGKKIKEMRKIRNYTARQLSELSGIARSLISQLETGKRQSTSMDTIYRLAKALDVPVSYFMAEESDEGIPAPYNQAHSISHFVINEDTLPYMSTLQKAQKAGITPELLNEFIDLIVRVREN
ncbi:helix-turn-helix transcriptional regulator [Desulfitobacterium sp.]|uniref:helix-turn-helix domain-containing protein n=1 Tax=Desulfitobacterium sp. TaxID=49981 RepID=UPI002B201580|nr:helix-turn-helix transcriptional regulator [Desulfitobacterium sp.]MEA4900340.1 helix-turn-helix transcriptional regulator [Desulfitobacterium sp.]